MNSFWPEIDLSLTAFVAPNATVMGRVQLVAGVIIWYGAVVRGDLERIEIGAQTNIKIWGSFQGDATATSRKGDVILF